MGLPAELEDDPETPDCCMAVLVPLVGAIAALALTSIETDFDEAVALAAARSALNRWRWHCREHREGKR